MLQIHRYLPVGLNYDGLYGINNINRFLQSSNTGEATTWGVATYKVGDPILFNETQRFGSVIYNNLKGKIVGMERFPDRVQFDVQLDRTITEFDVEGEELDIINPSHAWRATPEPDPPRFRQTPPLGGTVSPRYPPQPSTAATSSTPSSCSPRADPGYPK
jgi:hypothetical protein